VSVLGIIVIALAVIVVVFLVGGLIATRRRARSEEARLRAELDIPDLAQATAHAQDKGWHRDILEQAAREAFAQRSAAAVRELQLVQVVDKPGTEDDQAVFRVVTDRGERTIVLGRRDGAWTPA